MKFSIFFVAFAALFVFQVSLAKETGKEAKRPTPQTTASMTNEAAPVPVDQNDKRQSDRTVTEAQSIVALQCVTGDCYKDVFTDPCANIGENCIRPPGGGNAAGPSEPANTNQ